MEAPALNAGAPVPSDGQPNDGSGTRDLDNRALLALSCDWIWTLDPSFRLVSVVASTASQEDVGLGESAGLALEETVMRTICEFEHWETGGFFRSVDDKGTCSLVAGWEGPGMPRAAVDYYRSSVSKVVPAGGLLSRVLQTGEPIWLPSLEEEQTTWATRVRETGERATFVCPVRADGRIIGVFAFASREIREPDQPLLATLGAIGEQVGQFLQRKEAERVLRESEERFRALSGLSSDWYWELDADYRFTRLEGQHVEGLASVVLGKTRWELDLDIDAPGGWASHRAQLDARESFRDVVLIRNGGTDAERFISISGEPLLGRDGTLLGYRGVGQDVTAKRSDQKRIEHLATHDVLTGLPNRALYNEQLELAVHSADEGGHRVAVLFIDLDRFKSVNDTHGHAAGDVVLRTIALRIRHAVRQSDLVARLGGDEFVILIRHVASDEDVATVAAKVRLAVEQPIDLLGESLVSM